MYTELAAVTLKSGERAVIARVQTPDADWAPQIKPLLGHKVPPWRWQIMQTLEGEIAPLESYYYLALLGGEPIANVSTYEYAGVGIFGHVFTQEDHRRKGACRAIMEHQMEDFRRRGGKALFLGTGYDSAAWHIYSSFGFRSVYEKSGFMDYYAESGEAYEAAFFAPGTATVRPVDWRDWPGLTALTSQRAGSRLRLMGAGVHNRCSVEGSYLPMYKAILELDDQKAVTAESAATGAVVGVAAARPDPRFNAVRLLDLFVHPNFAGQSAALLEALGETPGKTQAYAESTDEAKIGALERAGFRVEATLEKQMRLDNGLVDVVVLSRS